MVFHVVEGRGIGMTLVFLNNVDFSWVVLFFVSEVSGEDSLLLELWLIKGCAFEVRMWEVGKS